MSNSISVFISQLGIMLTLLITNQKNIDDEGARTYAKKLWSKEASPQDRELAFYTIEAVFMVAGFIVFALGVLCYFISPTPSPHIGWLFTLSLSLFIAVLYVIVRSIPSQRYTASLGKEKFSSRHKAREQDKISNIGLLTVFTLILALAGILVDSFAIKLMS